MGACTAIVGGEATRTCTIPLSAVGNASVVTLEGLGTVEKPHVDVRYKLRIGFIINADHRTSSPGTGSLDDARPYA
jgi:hypothetical protein